jgi:hypothetical protein
MSYSLAKCISEAKIDAWRPNVTAYASRESLKMRLTVALDGGAKRLEQEAVRGYDTTFVNKDFAIDAHAEKLWADSNDLPNC